MEYSLADGKYKYFVYAGNKRIAEEKDGIVSYYHCDHLGSTRLVTNDTGVVVASYKFKPFGERDYYSGTFSSDYQFTGKPINDIVGLSYFSARWYDSESGRWLTQDPDRQGLNWYTFYLNNPINKIDPNGRWVETALDAVFLTWNVADIVSNPTDPVGYICLVTDGVCTVLPVVTGGRLAIKGAEALTEKVAGQIHHVATNKSIKSGFTKEFKRIFEKAGLELDDSINKMFLEGHKGRHSAKYNQYVLDRLKAAGEGLKGEEYTKAIKKELESLKEEISKNPNIVKGDGL